MADQKRDSPPERPNEDSIIGTWSPVWSRWENIPTPAEDVRDVTLTFAEGRCEVRRANKLIRSGTFSTDPAGSSATIDVCFDESDVPELTGAALRGIYELSGERLRVCYGPPGGARALTFSADKGSGNYVAEYRRWYPAE
jgi:uncharacterized protein (TIGR03067 family)